MNFLRKQVEGLKQGDPRAVAFTVVFLFFLSVLWFSYTWLIPQEKDALPVSNRYQPAPVEEEMSLSEILEAQQQGIEGEALNPFYLKPPPVPTRKPRPPRPTPNPTPAQTPNATPGPEPTRPPAAQRKTVTYVFQGMLKRPDGLTVALVSIPKQGKSVYVRTGDTLPPFTVTNVYQEGVEVQRGEEPPLLLLRGEPQTFDPTP